MKFDYPQRCTETMNKQWSPDLRHYYATKFQSAVGLILGLTSGRPTSNCIALIALPIGPGSCYSLLFLNYLNSVLSYSVVLIRRIVQCCTNRKQPNVKSYSERHKLFIYAIRSVNRTGTSNYNIPIINLYRYFIPPPNSSNSVCL